MPAGGVKAGDVSRETGVHARGSEEIKLLAMFSVRSIFGQQFAVWLIHVAASWRKSCGAEFIRLGDFMDRYQRPSPLLKMLESSHMMFSIIESGDSHVVRRSRDWQAGVKGLLKAELKRRDLSYRDLTDRLSLIGVKDNERNISNKIARGTFTAVFFMQCMEAIGCHTIHLGDS